MFDQQPLTLFNCQSQYAQTSLYKEESFLVEVLQKTLKMFEGKIDLS